MVRKSRGQRMVEAGGLLIDLRPPGDFEKGHLPGAKNLNMYAILLGKHVFSDKTQPLVLYCQAGVRSGIVAEFLKEAGYTNVYNMKTMDNW